MTSGGCGCGIRLLSVGIVGIPNVGKSTLFNALTNSKLAEASNYPFCTIEVTHSTPPPRHSFRLRMTDPDTCFSIL